MCAIHLPNPLSRAYGRERYQPLFAAMHRAALAGLGYGNDNPSTNGEFALLRRMAMTWPSRPTVLDVGAHVGEWTAAVLDVAPDALVYSLEPAPEPYRKLAERVGARAQALPVGLSSEPGEVALWGPPGHPGMASVHRRDLGTFSLTVQSGPRVKLTTLDHVCAEHSIEHIHLLKMDVEGHELNVLQGASKQLEAGAIEAIQLEFGGSNLDSRSYLRDFRDRLEPFGYTLHRILRNGVATAFRGEETAEIFVNCNFIAMR